MNFDIYKRPLGWKDVMPEIDLGVYSGPALLKIDPYPEMGMPDLDDSQGFWKALTWLAGRARQVRRLRPPVLADLTGLDKTETIRWKSAQGLVAAMLRRHGAENSRTIFGRAVLGEVTDLDKLALARACAEVTP